MCFSGKHLTEKQSKILKITVFIFNVLVLMSNLSCIVYFSYQLNESLERSYIAEYREDTCIPVSSDVIRFSCDSATNIWLPVWTDVKNRTVVYDPFSSKYLKSSAYAELKEIELRSTQPCMCRTTPVEVISDCQAWETCMLNTVFINYLQRDYSLHFQTNLSFIISSAISSLLSIITMPMSIRLYRETKSVYIELK